MPNLIEIPVLFLSITNATSAGTHTHTRKGPRGKVHYLSSSSVPKIRPLSADLFCHLLIQNFVLIICKINLGDV